MTQIGYYSRPFWPVYRPRTYFTSSYSGNLGFEYRPRWAPRSRGRSGRSSRSPATAGSCTTRRSWPRRPSDKINAVVVLFNDNAYGNVSRDLDEVWGGTYGAELLNPDFMKLADAYGVVGMRADEPTQVGDLVATRWRWIGRS